MVLYAGVGGKLILKGFYRFSSGSPRLYDLEALFAEFI